MASLILTTRGVPGSLVGRFEPRQTGDLWAVKLSLVHSTSISTYPARRYIVKGKFNILGYYYKKVQHVGFLWFTGLVSRYLGEKPVND